MVHNATDIDGRDANVDALEIFLHPGDIYFGSPPTIISTSLRSRVVITFWHPATKIGGMCHIVLMDSPQGKRDMHYGDRAIAEFARLANKYNTRTGDYEIRVFGGSGMLPDMQNKTGSKNGGINIEKVKDLLKANSFPVTEVDIADVRTRKLKLDLSDGKMEIRNTAAPASGQNQTIVQQDKVSNTKERSENEAPADTLEVFLHPGELFFGRAPTIVSTLLGSCVAVTIWHPKQNLGGMCHVVLPESTEGKYDMRYGDCAIGEFAKQAIKYSTRTQDYEVHVYGGSDMFPDMKKTSGMKIGDRNIDKINELLRLYKFHIKEVDTGGTNSRKIKLDLSDGSVWTRKTSRIVDG